MRFPVPHYRSGGKARGVGRNKYRRTLLVEISDLVRIRFVGEHQHRIPDLHQKCAKLLMNIIDEDILPKVEWPPLRNTSVSQLQNVPCLCFIALLLRK